MARIFVTSDDLTHRVELVADDEEGHWRAYCGTCTPAYDRYDSGPDLLRDSRERFTLNDAEQFAANHVDRCTRKS